MNLPVGGGSMVVALFGIPIQNLSGCFDLCKNRTLATTCHSSAGRSQNKILERDDRL